MLFPPYPCPSTAMSTPSPLPTTPSSYLSLFRPHYPHHKTRYYVHRVRESLTNRLAKFICSVFLTILGVAGVVVFIIWLALRPHRPRFHVVSFSVSNSLGPASTITFNVTERNPNENIGIYYGALEGSVYYREQPIGAARLLPAYYQPPKHTRAVRGVLSGDRVVVGEETREEFQVDVQADGRVGFRVELRSSVRFRVTSWDTHSHPMHVSCDVVVGPDGVILPEFRDKRCSIYFV